jgi:hypothetical protein
MSTTNLFVELIVIGVGASGWLLLLALAILGADMKPALFLLKLPAAALPALVCVYLLGIVIDRIADAVLQILRVERKRERYFETEQAMLEARARVLTGSEYFATQFDYNRSRQRICRGWILNALMLAVAFNAVLIAQPELVPHAGRISAFITPTLLLLAFGCWFAWEKLTDTEMKRVHTQAEFLRTKRSDT